MALPPPAKRQYIGNAELQILDTWASRQEECSTDGNKFACIQVTDSDADVLATNGTTIPGYARTRATDRARLLSIHNALILLNETATLHFDAFVTSLYHKTSCCFYAAIYYKQSIYAFFEIGQDFHYTVAFLFNIKYGALTKPMQPMDLLYTLTKEEYDHLTAKTFIKDTEELLKTLPVDIQGWCFQPRNSIDHVQNYSLPTENVYTVCPINRE